MNELQIFKNKEFGEVRTVVVDGEAYFSLLDICRVLEINNSRQAKKRLNRDGVISNDVIDKFGRTQKADFINESNLYKLVFQSRKPEAERFSEWVTSEILPSIRKHGAYMTEEKLSEVLLNPDTLIKLALNLKEEQEKNKRLNRKIEEDKPKVLFADAVSASSDCCLVGDLAKILTQNGFKIGQNRLFRYLRDMGFLCKSGVRYNTPTQRYVEQGLFDVKKRAIASSDGSVRVTVTTTVTGKGQQYFINHFLGE